jgi:hypothetical protein
MFLLSRLLEHAPYDARILDLDWEITDNREEPLITFYLGIGNRAKTLGSATAAELGLPVSLDAARRGFGRVPVLPENLRGALNQSLNEDSSHAIHIHFRRRDGYLAMIHWEALLRPIVGKIRRIRRLPYYSLPSVACAPNDLALIIDPTHTELTSPLHKIIGVAASSFSMGNGEISHLFASKSLVSQVQKLSDIKLPKKLHPYEAPLERSISPQRSHEKPAAIVDHAFLRWVSDRLEPSPVNSVVFVCQGGIEFHEGVIQLPLNPEQENEVASFSRSVAVDELATFLMHLGASACAFVDPNPTGPSGAGLRLLADRLAQRRPGLTAALDAAHSQELHEFFFDAGLWPPWFLFPSSGGYLSYEFPWLELAGYRILDVLERFTLLRDLVSEYAKHENVPSGGITHTWRLPQEPVPRWVVAVQRHLEMWAARILEFSVDDTVRLGIEDGVTNLRDTVRRFLQTSGGGAKT